MSENAPDPAKEKELAQKFLQFVMMQAQNIMFVLGKIPSPDGMSAPPNLEAAKMLIEQLEVIGEKTKGNLSPQEEEILKEALQSCNLAFVEASGGTPASMMPSRSPEFPDMEQEELEEAPEPSSASASPPSEPSPPQETEQGAPASSPSPQPAEEKDDTPPEPENKKKFFKSYG